jgi:hypothetical protein
MYQSIDANKYYETHRDMYHEFLTIEMFNGIDVKEDWVLLEGVPKPEAGRGYVSGGGIIMDQGRQSRVPIVFRVVDKGPLATAEINSYVCPIMSAGVNFGASLVALVREKDILFTWGNGIEKPAAEVDAALPSAGIERLKALGVIV